MPDDQLFTPHARELIAGALGQKGPHTALLVCQNGFLDQEASVPVSDGQALARLIENGFDPLTVLAKAEVKKLAAEEAGKITDAERAGELRMLVTLTSAGAMALSPALGRAMIEWADEIMRAQSVGDLDRARAVYNAKISALAATS